ncbi:ADP-ribosylglycohydrolase family protein [Sinorhizobium fredii]|nr:ADP-ribosylglycohydrolase family protein [Sinorhizobium fredii]MQW94101.1 ADP-ribosylglycohydrolase family protein [Sinorhizobium fredii]
MPVAIRKDRAIGALVGLAVGDAVGTTLEFKSRDSYEHLTDMVGGGPFGLAPGEWTDDTSMALCLADSLIANDGKIDQADLLERFVRWWRLGENSHSGRCFDIGNTTTRALEAYRQSGSLVNNAEENRQANGSIMRLAPAVIAAKAKTDAQVLAVLQGETTHAAPEPKMACSVMAGVLWDAILTGFVPPYVSRLGQTPRALVSSSGHVWRTFDAACWAVASTLTFKDAVLAAANLGDDADTVAAVAGQIAGAIYGYGAIPQDWRDKLAWHDSIVTRAEELWAIRVANAPELDDED